MIIFYEKKVLTLHSKKSMTKFNKLHVVICFCIFILLSCNNHKEKLDRIYNLINNDNNIDLAVAEFESIPFASIKTNEDKAFYKLIKVRLDYVQYIPIKSDTVINFSLNYYREVGDKAKEAECLFYKSQILREYMDEGKDGIVYLKQAETLLSQMDDIDIKHRIYETLADVNLIDEIYNVALDYALINLNISEQADNKDWMAYAYIMLSQIYRNINDSINEQKYYRLCMDNIKYLSANHKADFYNYLASEYLTTDLGKAAFYAEKCIGSRNNAAGYINLAKIAQKNREYTMADSLYRKAIDGATPFYKSIAWESIVNMYSEQGDYKKALDMHLEYCKVKDSIAVKRKKDGIHHRQMEYDYQLKELEMQQRITYWTFGIVVTLLLAVIVSVFTKYRYNKVQKRVLEYQKIVDGYTSKIKALEKEISDTRQTGNEDIEQQKRINDMRQRIDELKGRQAEILRDGKQRYDEIMEQGGTTARWSKNDFVHFMEYYRIVDLTFINYLETEYDHLSPKYCFFEILQNVGKSDEEIMRILGISDSTLRSTRSRIKSKKFSEE